ncbi:MAG: tetratricopeptide repeat protein [Deltaproteobacteria bacterium]|jgi:tetratricopeptide (TPR) repeat protein|nr:tetratricopeptide repeat protein [Deltaproteobacteria bacterium]
MSKHIDYEINKELGECYLFMGEFDKAADYYNKAAACDAGHAAPYLGLATIAMQKKDSAGAAELYRKALELEESDKPLTGLGLANAELGNNEEAFEYFVKALKKNPTNLIAMNGMVQLAYVLNRVADTLPRLEAALQIQENETVRFTLAGCLSYQGRDEEAREQLEILLADNPANASAQELYARIAA